MPNHLIRDDEKELFLNTLNKKGFMLEYKTYKTLQSLGYEEIQRNWSSNFFGERVEIDVIFVSGGKRFIVECKRTEYTWVFAKDPDVTGSLHLISTSLDKGHRKHEIQSKSPSQFSTVNDNIAVMFDPEGKLKKENKKVKIAQIGYNDLHDHIRQVLKETGAYISEAKFLAGLIIPVVVTNANLFCISFLHQEIDSYGDLKDYKTIEEVPYVAYNFPEVLKYFSMSRDIEEFLSPGGEHQLKTVFIVNIRHIPEFVAMISGQKW